MGNLQGKLPQSLPICLGLAAAGGISEVFATAVLAYAEAKAKDSKVWSPARHRLALAGNIILQIIASIFGNLLAPWFGPVSQVGTVFQSAQLLANMVIFGTVLGLETFTKDMKIGTYVVVVAVVLVLFVGPMAQENQNVMRLLSAWYAILWNAIVLVGMIVSYFFILLDVTKLRELHRIAVLAAARSTAFAVNLTTSRIMVTCASKAFVVVSIILKIVSGGIMTHAIVVQSTAVLQAKFVPLNASMIILVNALTGVIVWEDWRSVASWPSYACAFVLIFLGNYLLLGDVQLFDASNEKYGRGAVLGRMRGRRHIFFTEHSREEGHNKDDGGLRDDESVRLENEPSEGEESRPASIRLTRSATSRRAWMDVYGIHGQLTLQGRSRRMRHIFLLDRRENDGDEEGIRLAESSTGVFARPGTTRPSANASNTSDENSSNPSVALSSKPGTQPKGATQRCTIVSTGNAPEQRGGEGKEEIDIEIIQM